MKITAEKMLQGRIVAIEEYSYGFEVVVKIPDAEDITAVLTKSAVKKLGLKVGMPFIRDARLACG